MAAATSQYATAPADAYDESALGEDDANRAGLGLRRRGKAKCQQCKQGICEDLRVMLFHLSLLQCCQSGVEWDGSSVITTLVILAESSTPAFGPCRVNVTPLSFLSCTPATPPIKAPPAPTTV